MNNEIILFNDDVPRMLSNGQYETDGQLFTRKYGVNAQPMYLYNRDAAFTEESPQITTAVQVLGAPIVRTWLQAHLYDLAIFCGTQQHVTESQTAQIADLMISSYNLKASEYVLFFAMMKSGELDLPTSYIDGRVIMKALRRFVTEYKGNALARIEREQGQAQRADTPTRAEGLLNLRDYNRQARAEGKQVNAAIRIPDELLYVDDETFLRHYTPKEMKI